MPTQAVVAPALQKYKELLLKLHGRRFVDERAWCVRVFHVERASTSTETGSQMAVVRSPAWIEKKDVLTIRFTS